MRVDIRRFRELIVQLKNLSRALEDGIRKLESLIKDS
jgi:hypothetical protein